MKFYMVPEVVFFKLNRAERCLFGGYPLEDAVHHLHDLWCVCISVCVCL